MIHSLMCIGISENNVIVKLSSGVKVESSTQVDRRYMEVVWQGGQGVLFRKPNSKYMEHESFFKHVTVRPCAWSDHHRICEM